MKRVIGGVIAMVIGGSAFAIGKSGVVSEFSRNTGLSQQQAQQYVNNIPKSDLVSFSKAGQSFIGDGNSILNQASNIDCLHYTYQWVTSTLSCQDGESQLQSAGNDEVTLGHCYVSLGTNLGNSAKSRMRECISDIDKVDLDYGLPVVTSILNNNESTTAKEANAYNKSVLQTALNSH